MADAKPTGKLTTGAVGNFLLGGAMALMALSGAVGGLTGGGAGGAQGAGALGLIAFLFIVGGGITGALGWFGLGSLHGGTNTLAGIFSIIFAVVPVALIVIGMGGGMNPSAIGMIFLILLLPPGLLGLFGGLGVMKGANAMAKPAGIVLLIGGIATTVFAALAVASLETVVTSPGLAAILTYVGFFGLAIGFFLTGAAMLGEKNA